MCLHVCVSMLYLWYMYMSSCIHMYVCMYICTACMCVHAYMCAYSCKCMHMSVFMSVYYICDVCVHVPVCAAMYMYVCVRCAHMHTCVCIQVS